MHNRTIGRCGVAVVALAAVLFVPVVALAGGLAVVVDKQPEGVMAGTPFTIGFMVQSAHEGQEPMDGLSPAVVFTKAGADEQFTETARREGPAANSRIYSRRRAPTAICANFTLG